MAKYREHVIIRVENGRVIGEKKIMDSRAARMESLNGMAVVVSLEEGEYHSVYRNGEEHLERFDGLYLGKHAEFDRHLGWIS